MVISLKNDSDPQFDEKEYSAQADGKKSFLNPDFPHTL